uniref:Ig-like domain-containing protein n=1 Tax=Lates calcarifer TaxID=8187 RepID=A0A4W6DSG1_LATCA
MKTPSVSLLLGVSVLLLSGLTVSAVSLNVSPNRLQFFKGESVSLRCEGQVVSDGQTVKRTRGGQTEDCGPASGFGRFDGSSCNISGLSLSDSGGYWCEDRADQINISVINTVTDKAGVPVILEIPALPVMTGSDVTLRCRDKDNNRFKAFFFRDGKDLGSGPDGELPLSKVQQSHEGLYWCYRNKGFDSPQSRLRVRDSSFSSLLLPVVAALGSLVLLVLVLVGLVLWWRKQTGPTPSPAPDDVTYCDVTVRHTANRKDKHSAAEDTVYSGVRTHTADFRVLIKEDLFVLNEDLSLAPCLSYDLISYCCIEESHDHRSGSILGELLDPWA